MWGYTGSKWAASVKYPEPLYETIIEPLAGSAGYSLRYADHKVILCEINPDVVTIWRMIQKNKNLERRLPAEIAPGTVVEEMRGIDEEVRLFLHYKTCAAHAGYHLKFTDRGAARWPLDRRRVLAMAHLIKHWDVRCESFDRLEPPRGPCTWFVDPPYQQVIAAGRGDYKFKHVNYGVLANHVRNVWRGQVIVCEQEGANWLPFRPLYNLSAQHYAGCKLTTEVMYYNDGAKSLFFK
jgi:site-specific DNA-adenine methylase